MANIKTAVSIEKSLFEQAEDMAHKMNMSRSRLFALALEDFIRRLQNEELLQRINDAYQDGPDPDEQAHLRMMGSRHRKVVEGEW